MDLTGISKSILSISSPGTNVASDVALNETVIRATNDSAANIRRLSPTHFGCFAALPLADIPSSIAESAYTIDALNADGFVLHSSIINIYLSNPILQAVLAELNEGNAIAFIHPTVTYHYAPVTMYALPAERYAASSSLANHHGDLLFESFFDSTRSILDLIGSATILHFPGIRWVIPYCGDVLSSLLNRSFLILRLGQPSTSTRFCLPITEEEIKRR